MVSIPSDVDFMDSLYISDDSRLNEQRSKVFFPNYVLKSQHTKVYSMYKKGAMLFFQWEVYHLETQGEACATHRYWTTKATRKAVIISSYQHWKAWPLQPQHGGRSHLYFLGCTGWVYLWVYQQASLPFPFAQSKITRKNEKLPKKKIKTKNP